VRSGWILRRPPAPVRSPDLADRLDAFSPPAQMTVWVWTLVSSEHNVTGRLLLNSRVQADFHAALRQHSSRRRSAPLERTYSVSRAPCRPEQYALRSEKTRVLVLQHPVHQVSQRSAISVPVAPAPTITKVQCSLRNKGRVRDPRLPGPRGSDERSNSASCSEYRGKLFRSAPGMSKKSGL